MSTQVDVKDVTLIRYSGGNEGVKYQIITEFTIDIPKWKFDLFACEIVKWATDVNHDNYFEWRVPNTTSWVKYDFITVSRIIKCFAKMARR